MTILEWLQQQKDNWGKLGTTISCIAALAGGAGYMLGGDEPALFLDSPFSLRIQGSDTTNDWERLVLTEDPSLGSPEKGMRYFRVRQSKSAFEIVPIGIVLAQDLRIKWSHIDLSLAADATAQEKFDWRGHQNDQRYKEWWNDKTREFWREYADGCILAYKVDERQRSIPSSFRWERRTH